MSEGSRCEHSVRVQRMEPSVQVVHCAAGRGANPRSARISTSLNVEPRHSTLVSLLLFLLRFFFVLWRLSAFLCLVLAFGLMTGDGRLAFLADVVDPRLRLVGIEFAVAVFVVFLEQLGL